tara:strand:+ start:384 stop:617 length:234 start_codon:yes stop_codon:yes gene_type:complete
MIPNLDPNIMQTKTMGKVVNTLKKVRNRLRIADDKDLKREVVFIIKEYEKNISRMKNHKKTEVLSDNSFTGVYKVNL